MASSPFQHENLVNLNVICEFLQVVTRHDNPEGACTDDFKVRAIIFDGPKALQLCTRWWKKIFFPLFWENYLFSWVKGTLALLGSYFLSPLSFLIFKPISCRSVGNAPSLPIFCPPKKSVDWSSFWASPPKDLFLHWKPPRAALLFYYCCV